MEFYFFRDKNKHKFPYNTLYVGVRNVRGYTFYTFYTTMIFQFVFIYFSGENDIEIPLSHKA
jgi:hypothetical protein